MKPEEFKQMYSELTGAFPKHYNTEGAEAIWSRKFAGKNAKIFRILVDQLSMKDEFPAVGYAIATYMRLAGQKNKNEYQSKGNIIPPEIANMGPDQVKEDYEKMKSFMEAYPFPGYPFAASPEECQKIDDNYNDLMRKNGIDPKAPTNHEVGKLLMRDLLGDLPELGVRNC